MRISRWILAGFAIIVLASSTADAVPYAIVADWSKTFGGAENDEGSSVQAADGGYVIAGSKTTFGEGGSNLWLIKTDLNGNNTGEKIFKEDGQEYAVVIQRTPGGYIILAKKSSGGLRLVRIDSGGTVVWQKTYNKQWEGNSLQVSTQGNEFFIAGVDRSTKNALLLKVGWNGAEKWNKTFGGQKEDSFESVQVTKDGGLILAGKTKSYGKGDWDLWLVKTDADGKEQWRKAYGRAKSDFATSVLETEDGGYIATGAVTPDGKDKTDLWILKTNSTGFSKWDRVYGGKKEDVGRSIIRTYDGGYMIAGETSSFGSGGSDAWLIKTDSNGFQQGNQTFGGAGNDYARFLLASSGAYIVAGTKSAGAGNSDAWLMRIRTGEVGTAKIDGDKKTCPVEVGKLYFVKIEDIAREGDGIAWIDGFVIFTPETKVGDQLWIVIDKVMKRFAIAHRY